MSGFGGMVNPGVGVSVESGEIANGAVTDAKLALTTPALGAPTATTIQTSGNVGIGVAPSATNGRRLEVTQNGDQVTRIAAANSEASGVSAQSQIRSQADVASINLSAYGSGNTTSRWGLTMGGDTEVLGGVGGGALAVGTAGTTDLHLGTAGTTGIRLNGTNPHPSFPVSDKRVTSQFDAAATTTLATVTGLSVTVTAGRTYRFEAILHVSADATGGHKYAIGGTCTATAVIYQINSVNNATNAFRINARQTALGGSSGDAAGTVYFTRIDGTITVNAAGTLLVQFAQNVASGTSSVLAGSTFTVVEVA